VIIFRYLSKEVLATLLATTLILLIIFISNQFVHYLSDAADGKITTQAVMKVMSLQVPLLLGYLLPLSLFLGLLLTLGRLCVDHEMVVLSSCGVSRTQLVTMIMMLATLVTGVVAWLMLSVEPKMQYYRAEILTNALATSTLGKIMPGRFQQIGDSGRVFYAASIGKHREPMGQVFLAEKQSTAGAERWDLVSADQANDMNTAKNGHFILFKNGFRYVGAPGQVKFDIVKFDQYGIRLYMPPEDFAARVEAMPTMQLWHQTRNDRKADAEFQWRIALPISVLVFALLAVPLSHVNPRKGKFAQMLPAILIYIVYANFMFVGRAWLEKGIVNRHFGLWWVDALLFVLALILLFVQSSWWQRLRALNRRRRYAHY
jgi:lipopolysaccharide export system permease protein